MIIRPSLELSVNIGMYMDKRNPASIVITDNPLVCVRSSAVAANEANRADTKQ